MNLHENRDLFLAAIQNAAEPAEKGGFGIKQIYLEKDYWICRSLKLLSQSKDADVAVFKGGTSLSKAYGLGYRFSEDLDIAITSDDTRTDNQTKNIISHIAKAMSSGLEEVMHPATRKFSKYRKTFYRYPTISDGIVSSAISAGQILLEIVSFANPYPYQKLHIRSFLTEYLEKIGRDDIISQYGMEGFDVNVLALSRTATEKLVSLIRHSLADDYILELKSKIRHFYDLHYLYNELQCRAYLQSPKFKEDFNRLLGSDRERFKEPSGWNDRDLQESPLIKSFDELWEELSATYAKELPELAYQAIPEAEQIATSIKSILKMII